MKTSSKPETDCFLNFRTGLIITYQIGEEVNKIESEAVDVDRH
ncbi:hypothetical protein [Dolichospermum flos-aquae]|jgi:hypothetical protein|nr:hypothetical protein [Dolichospermum flos-aquae]